MLFLLLVTTCIGYGQTKSDSVTHKAVNINDILSNVNKRMDHLNNDSIMKSLATLSKEDSALKKALSDYNLFGLSHRKKALQWNLTSSIIIFWSVICLVFSGIFFAGIQFYVSMQMAKKSGTAKGDDLATQLEATMQGIKVNSPVLGVIILVISILFFFLYLKYVYPIMEIF
ncbi:MAG: hypothetical protein H0X41_05720 [Chitinophagaceae bacterium]|nr:hypothetical protein [Chitinophagaceae bacterium]